MLAQNHALPIPKAAAWRSSASARAEDERVGAYRLGDGTMTAQAWSEQLSYAALATAVADELTHPTRHREQAAVQGVPTP